MSGFRQSVVFLVAATAILFLSVEAFGDRRPPKHKSFEGEVPELKIHEVPAVRAPRPGAPAVKPADEDKLSISLPIKVKDESKLTKLELKILKAIQKGDPVSFKDITRAWLEWHLRKFNKRDDTSIRPEYLEQVMNRILRVVDEKDPFAFKQIYELRMKHAFHGNKHAKYNVENHNPVDLLLKNRLQCVSGSVCYSLLARNAWGAKDYTSKKPVFVFQDGHMAPGFIAKDDKNEDWVVLVETTALGKARDPLAPVKKLEEMKDKPAVVIDANLYPLIEIFDEHLDGPDRLAIREAALKSTGDAHGYDWKKIQDNVRDYMVNHKPPADPKDRTGNVGATTPIGFGFAAEKPGDQERHYVGSETAPKEPSVLVRQRTRPKPAGERVKGTLEGKEAPKDFKEHGKIWFVPEAKIDHLNVQKLPKEWERLADRVIDLGGTTLQQWWDKQPADLKELYHRMPKEHRNEVLRDLGPGMHGLDFRPIEVIPDSPPRVRRREREK